MQHYQFDFSKPMLVRVTGMFSSSSLVNARSFVAQIFKSFFARPRITGLSLKADLKVIISYKRPDLLRDFDQLISFLDGEVSKVKIVLGSHRPCLIAITDFIIAGREYPHVVYEIEKHLTLSFTQRITTYLAIAEIAKLRRFFEKQIRANDTLIFTMEMQFYDNILAQVSRSHCVRSFAFQHGFYHDDGLIIKTNNINPVNYLAAVCEKALVWGDRSADLLRKYTRQTPIIVGKPTLIAPLSANSQEPMHETPSQRLRVLAILDSVKNREKNVELLSDLLATYESISFISHPDDTEPYPGEGLVPTKHSSVKYDAVFCINSSAAIQYGYAGNTIFLHPDSAIARLLDVDAATHPTTPLGKRGYFKFDESENDSDSQWKSFIACDSEDCRNELRCALSRE